MTVGLQHHSTESRVNRKPRQLSTKFCQPLIADRGELLKQQVAIADGRLLGRLEEGEPGNVTETDGSHLQDDRRKVGAQNLRLGELFSRREIVLVVQPDTDPRGNAAATTGPLIRRRLRYRLDRQPLHFEAAAISRNPRAAGIDHISDAGNSERCLRNICGQHDTASAYATLWCLEDAVLLNRR